MQIVGASKAVRIPYVYLFQTGVCAYFPLTSIARDVPTACEAVPIDKPCAMGLPTCPTCNTLNPQMAPNSPTTITTAAVNEGMPPTESETSIAIGVVTDFGASDIITSGSCTHQFRDNGYRNQPTIHPANWEIRIGNSCFRIIFNCR